MDDPASQPYVVAVGGTTIDNPTQPALEHVWNDGVSWGAGGGGISQAWPMPAWQYSPTIPGLGNSTTIQAADSFEASDLSESGYAFCRTDNPAGATQAACREVPDVSAQADEFTGGITVYGQENGGWQTSGGTSSSAPIWAALLAVVNQSATCQANASTQSGVGFVNPLLYSVASNPTAYAASFNDITAGNNDPYGYSGLYPATTGYDMASGLGSPRLTQPGNGAGLAYYLCTAAATPSTRPTVTGISANVAFTSSASTAVTITGTNFESNATPDVAEIQVGEYVLPQADFQVTSPTSISATFPAAAKVNAPQSATDGAGRVQVVVTLNDGESSPPSAGSTFTYVDNNGANAIPSVTSVGPYGGADAGGNTVNIYGAGFTNATGVKFGNVAASGFTVLHDWEITATVPAYSGATTCAEDGSSFGTGESATNDVCQAQVVVSNSHGSSKKATILPLFEGDATFNALGVIPAPAGQEAAPAPTEYDYFPSPTITSISTDGGPSSLASEDGSSVVTITGTGLNSAGLKWVSFGDDSQADSQDSSLVTVTGTEIQIAAPAFASPTTGAATVPVTVHTLAGQSVTVAGDVRRDSDRVGSDRDRRPDGRRARRPEHRRHADRRHGTRLLGPGSRSRVRRCPRPVHRRHAVQRHRAERHRSHLGHGPAESRARRRRSVHGDGVLVPVTDPRSTRSCSTRRAIPRSTRSRPPRARLRAARAITITGENLGCVTGVYFGKVAALKVSNAKALLDCGSTTQATVVAPPGTQGKSVKVTLTTVESDLTGFGSTTDIVHFTLHAPRGADSHRAARRRRLRHGHELAERRVVREDLSRTGSPYQSVVTLTAHPAAGSRFVGWSTVCKNEPVVRDRSRWQRAVPACG